MLSKKFLTQRAILPISNWVASAGALIMAYMMLPISFLKVLFVQVAETHVNDVLLRCCALLSSFWSNLYPSVCESAWGLLQNIVSTVKYQRSEWLYRKTDIFSLLAQDVGCLLLCFCVLRPIGVLGHLSYNLLILGEVHLKYNLLIFGEVVYWVVSRTW